MDWPKIFDRIIYLIRAEKLAVSKEALKIYFLGVLTFKKLKAVNIT